MWMPQQIAAHASTLRSLGLEIDPAALSEPLSPTLSAIVSLGGCSASLVSPDGLIITNHHCVQGTLQYNATPERNLVEDGYLAATRADELWNGPTSRVFVTQAITDVSEQILADLDSISDDRARYDAIESREKTLVAACERDRPQLRCSIKSYFRGAEYYLTEQLEIRDVRLVYSPPRGIGYFGGDEDNWMWPRHVGDFAMYRAYVGPDGAPADHAPENVPFKAAHHLEVATAPLGAGDLVIVAGYPGYTQRYRTAAEVREAVNVDYPYQIAMFEDYLAVLREAAARGEETAIKAHTWIVGLENALKNRRGMLDGLERGGLAQQKIDLERELRAWIDADPARQASYGDVLDQMGQLQQQAIANRARARGYRLLGFSRLLREAERIVRMAEERPKPDAERDPDYQARNWDRMKASSRQLSRSYDPAIDRALLAVTLRRAIADIELHRGWLEIIFGDQPIVEASIEPVVTRLYANTTLADEATRIKLYDSASTESLGQMDDALIQLAVALRPFGEAIEAQEKRLAGAVAVLEPRYIAALREFSGGALAPDANGSLRVTYGTVRGYRPTPDADRYEPFTRLSEVVAKHTDKAPFDAPDELLAAAANAEQPSRYVAAALGEVPVNFLSDVDTTGGNSGSATLNGRGELVGLLFDGNYESMASDWLFIPALTRGIHLDIRYALWILDEVEGAHHLLAEMGVAADSSAVKSAAATPAK